MLEAESFSLVTRSWYCCRFLVPACRLATISDLYLIQVMVSDRDYLAAALGLTEIANIASALIFKE